MLHTPCCVAVTITPVYALNPRHSEHPRHSDGSRNPHLLRLRKGARGMPCHTINAETPNNNHTILKSFPILQILVHITLDGRSVR